MGLLMSFFTGFIFLLILNLIINTNAFTLNKFYAAGPWYVWMGGLIGVVFVGYIT